MSPRVSGRTASSLLAVLALGGCTARVSLGSIAAFGDSDGGVPIEDAATADDATTSSDGSTFDPDAPDAASLDESVTDATPFDPDADD